MGPQACRGVTGGALLRLYADRVSGREMEAITPANGSRSAGACACEAAYGLGPPAASDAVVLSAAAPPFNLRQSATLAAFCVSVFSRIRL